MRLYGTVVSGCLAFGIACGAASQARNLSPEARNVRISKQEPTGNCEELRPIAGKSGGMSSVGTYEASVAELKFKASEIGANYVVLDTNTKNGNFLTLSGRAFKCM